MNDAGLLVYSTHAPINPLTMPIATTETKTNNSTFRGKERDTISICHIADPKGHQNSEYDPQQREFPGQHKGHEDQRSRV
ncbi:hypothetical protein ACFQ3W_18810 [Paenibacillus puldeungensis]|uniref:Uncharacterized protein n=1 Tax=Paenibacillus puldeungensis TaxID=696536 RepID=A0ABW3S2L4_9BACL